MIPSLFKRLAAALLFTSLTSVHTLLAQGGGKPFTIDDILKMYEIGAMARSPDGEMLAVTVTRPAVAGEWYLRQMRGNERSDIWIVSMRDASVRKITEGAKNQSGFWSPSWSPDGKRLAFYTVIGDGPVQLNVWDRASGAVKHAIDRSIDPYLTITTASPSAITWLSDKTVLAAIYPLGSIGGRERGQLAITDAAIAGWKKTEHSEEPAASVVTSGPVKRDTTYERKTLAIVDVTTGKLTTLFDANVQQGILSPDGTQLAVPVDAGMRQPRAGHTFSFSDSRLWKLAVVSVSSPGAIRWIAGVHTSGPPSPRWSPDATKLVFVGALRDGGPEEVAFTIIGDSARAALPAGWTASSIMWGAGGDLLIHSTGLSAPPADEKPVKPPRADWYVVSSSGGTPRNVTSSMHDVPGSLQRAGASLAIGLAKDTLWSIDLGTGTATALTPGLAKVTSIVWPAGDVKDGQVIVKAGEKTAPTLHRATVGASPSVVAFASPSPIATLKEFDAKTGATVFEGNLPDGTYLWLGGPNGEFRKALALNEFLAGVEAGRKILVSYKGVEGDTLKAIVVLPVGYQEGKKYPAVAWVYAGSVFHDTVDVLSEKQFVHGLNLQALAGHGFVVVLPSMPLAPDGTASDPYIDLPKGVINAMDKVVEMGIADPDKLGVMGQSYGGYSTMTLVTYTNRFKAAVELAGPPDLINFYSVFEPPQRYDANADESMFAPRWAETGQGRMGKPPWEDLWRYLRNSPLYYVERVNTPLLLIQGDLDFVSMTGGEQFFTALKRLGKPARFVRVWGEGHVFEAPANIRYQWKEILDWFDTYFKADSTTKK